MKIRVVLLCLVLTFLCACSNDKDRSTFDAAKDSVMSQTEKSEAESDCPIRIISKYGDDLTVEVTKAYFESLAKVSDYQQEKIYFYDENRESLFYVQIEYGAAIGSEGINPAKCFIYMDDYSDSSTNIFSNPGYIENGDIICFNFDIDIDGVTISGADNHPFPENIAAKTTFYTMDAGAAMLSAKGVCQVRGKYTEEELAAKENGKEEIESILYTNDEDRARLTPDSEDYRVVVMDFPEICIYTKYVTGVNIYGEPYGCTSYDECEQTLGKYISVCSYDTVGNVISIKEKFDFGTEYNAIHNYWTSYRDCFYWPNNCGNPVDVNNETAALTYISDNLVTDLMRQYYIGSFENRKLKINRVGSCYYAVYEGDDLIHSGDSAAGGTLCFLANLGIQCNYDSYDLSANMAEVSGFVSTAELNYNNASATPGSCTLRMYYSNVEKHSNKIYSADSTDESSAFDIGTKARGYCPYNFDSQYFIPVSDDYILYYSSYDWEPNPTETERASLISFDEGGKCIQCVYRYVRPDNMVNSMSELLPDSDEGTLLYSDDKVYYLDMSTASENYAEFYYFETKDEYLQKTIDSELINMPGYGWNDSTAIYISKN